MTEKTTKKKVVKKKVAKKAPMTAIEKAQLKAAKDHQKRVLAENKKAEARTEAIKLIQKDFTKLCKSHGIKGVMVFDSLKLDTNGRVFQEKLTQLEVAGLCNIGQQFFKQS